MRLLEELLFEQASLLDVHIEPADPEPKVRLEFKAALPPEKAEALRCRDLVYAGSVPRSGVDSVTLEGEELQCTVAIFSEKGTAQIVSKSVGHGKVLFEGTGPEIKFRVTLAGYAVYAAELATELCSEPVRLVLKPAQMALELTKENAEPEAAEEPEGAADFVDELVGEEQVHG